MAYSWNPGALEKEPEPRPTMGDWWSHPSWRSLPFSGEPGGSGSFSSALDVLDDAAAPLPTGSLLGSPAAGYDDDTSLGRVAASSSASPSFPRGGIVPVPVRDALDLLADLHAVRSRP